MLDNKITINSTINNRPIIIDDVPAFTESAPSEGPTTLWSTIVTGTGNAPARNTIAISSAS